MRLDSLFAALLAAILHLPWALAKQHVPHVDRLPHSGHGALFAAAGSVSFNLPLQLDVLLEQTALSQELGVQVVAARSLLAQISSQVSVLPASSQNGLTVEFSGISRLLHSLARDKQQLDNIVLGQFSKRRKTLKNCPHVWPLSENVSHSNFGPFHIQQHLFLNGTAPARKALATEAHDALQLFADLKWDIETYTNYSELELEPESQQINKWFSMATDIKSKFLLVQKHVDFATDLTADLLSVNSQPDLRGLPRVESLLKFSSQAVRPIAASLLGTNDNHLLLSVDHKVCFSNHAFRVSMPIDLPYAMDEFDLFEVIELPVALGDGLTLVVQNSDHSMPMYLAADASRTHFVSLDAAHLASCEHKISHFTCAPHSRKLTSVTANCNVARFLLDQPRADKMCHKAILRTPQVKTAVQFRSDNLTAVFAGNKNSIVYHCDANCSNPQAISLPPFALIQTQCRLVLDDFQRVSTFSHKLDRNSKGDIVFEPVWSDNLFFFTPELLRETLLRVKDTDANSLDLLQPLPITDLIPQTFDRQDCDWLCSFSIRMHRFANYLGVPTGIVQGICFLLFLLSIFLIILLIWLLSKCCCASSQSAHEEAPVPAHGSSRSVFPYAADDDDFLTPRSIPSYSTPSDGNDMYSRHARDSHLLRRHMLADDDYEATTARALAQRPSTLPCNTRSSRLSLNLANSPDYMVMLPLSQVMQAISETIVAHSPLPPTPPPFPNAISHGTPPSETLPATENKHASVSTFVSAQPAEHQYATILGRPKKVSSQLSPEYINLL
jgi:hypothetical protein